MKRMLSLILALSLVGCAAATLQGVRGVASGLKASPATPTLQADWDTCIEQAVPVYQDRTTGELISSAVFYPLMFYYTSQRWERTREVLRSCMGTKGYTVEAAAYEEEQVPKLR